MKQQGIFVPAIPARAGCPPAARARPYRAARVSRLAVAGAGALAVTCALTLVMTHLIEPRGTGLNEAVSVGTLEFLPRLDDTDPDPKPRKVDKPEPPQPPPETKVATVVDAAGDGVGAEVLRGVGPVLDRGPIIAGPGDGDALLIASVTPVYPQRLKERGVQGWVLLQFSVDELGRVRDVVVLDGKPRGAFDRAATDAVQRFKYKPLVQDGAARTVRGLRKRITFELT